MWVIGKEGENRPVGNTVHRRMVEAGEGRRRGRGRRGREGDQEEFIFEEKEGKR